MGQKQFDVVSDANVAITTTNETVVATLSGVSTPRKSTITLKGSATITTGANTTALTPRIRRGTTIAGTLIGEANPVQVQAAAGSSETVEVTASDANIDLAAGSYVLTVQATGATADATALTASLTASMPD